MYVQLYTGLYVQCKDMGLHGAYQEPVTEDFLQHLQLAQNLDDKEQASCPVTDVLLLLEAGTGKNGNSRNKVPISRNEHTSVVTRSHPPIMHAVQAQW